jgi:hypothetical protein
MVEYFPGPSTTAKDPPKTHIFWIDFIGPRGGIRTIKFRLPYVPKRPIKTIAEAKAIVSKMADEGYVTRALQWNTPSRSTPYAHVAGNTRGYLIYARPSEEVMKDPRVKKAVIAYFRDLNLMQGGG